MNSDALLAYLKIISFSSLRDPMDIIADLQEYALLLEKWQKIQNLVSRETLSDLWHRHFFDSLQIMDILFPQDRVLVDIGSGGGLPAIPIAIAYKPQTIEYHLIESNKRKVSFLKTVGRELNISVEIHGVRAEQISKDLIPQVDVVTSRATAPLKRLFEIVYPLSTKATRCIFHKGVDYSVELDESRANWQFDVIDIPSKTSNDSVILDIRNLEKRSTGV